MVDTRRPLLPVEEHLGLVRHLLFERQLRAAGIVILQCCSKLW